MIYLQKTIRIKLVNGFTTLIDKGDLPKMKQGRRWYAWHHGKRWMVRGYVKGKNTLLHRHLLGLKSGDPEVDHINRNSLDNRKANLRLVTDRQQVLNRDLSYTNKSGYRGVFQRGNRWKASGWLNYKQYHLGYFDTPEEASWFVEDFYDTH